MHGGHFNQYWKCTSSASVARLSIECISILCVASSRFLNQDQKSGNRVKQAQGKIFVKDQVGRP